MSNQLEIDIANNNTNGEEQSMFVNAMAFNNEASEQVAPVGISPLAAAPLLTISPSTAWSIAAAGSSRTITVTTNQAWSMSRPTWLSANRTSASGSSSFTLTASRNNGAARSGTVWVTTGDLTRTFSVSQAAEAPSLTISPSTAWSIAAAGSSRTITVTSNQAWSMSRPTWLSAIAI
jgi:predicted metal-dependent enzyme (double-stranded beta helix superfamily)